jgi:hypothetical protein
MKPTFPDAPRRLALNLQLERDALRRDRRKRFDPATTKAKA